MVGTSNVGVWLPLQFWISGWLQLTTIGATCSAWAGASTRAFAFAVSFCGVTMPSTLVKMPESDLSALTEIVSFALYVDETTMFADRTSPPFLFA